MNIAFLYPKFLFFLFLVPLLILAYFASIFYYKKKAIMFSNFEALERVFGVEIISRGFIALIINAIILALLILSLAGISVSYSSAKAGSYALAIDSSGSMAAKDVLPDRIGAAKNSAKIFISKLPGESEIGVIVFSEKAEILQNLESSKIKAGLAIDSIELKKSGGTDIDSIIDLSINLLEGRERKTLVIVSDGQVNSGNIARAVQNAKDTNIVIDTVAIGTFEGGEVLGSVSKVDEDSLRKIAFETGGKFLRAEDLKTLDLAFEEISGRQVSLNLSQYFLAIAIILFFISWILYAFKFRSIP